MRVLGIVLFHRSSMHPTLVVPRLFLCQNLRPPLFIRRANPLIVMPSIDEPLRADPIGAVSENGREVVLGVEALLGSGTDGVVVASGQGSVAAIIILSGPSTSQQAHTSSLASERLKGVVVNDYESDSDIDPEDMRLFEKSFTRVDMRAGGPSRVLEISSNFNLLENTVDLVEQFDLLCSAVESRFLREISDSGLSRGVAGMALRTYMLEIESASRAETRAEVFLKMIEKYCRYRNKCREMHMQLRMGCDTRSLKEELEKKDE
uniref:Uncharacterized protein n=1 Tax=Nicotiana tabacum TaxID=4097 RepID=A0A1S4BDR2_TOBAC|nr:PREDICTED: uncharacterized protein LOC107807156 [Nicotiana tabacum]